MQQFARLRQGVRRQLSSVASPKSGGSGLSQFGGVHGSTSGGRAGSAKIWRNKPLLRREGDKIFKTGGEAVQLLNSEAQRKDSDCLEFISSWESVSGSLNVVFDRMPKYAWIMKQLLEPGECRHVPSCAALLSSPLPSLCLSPGAPVPSLSTRQPPPSPPSP